MPLRLSAAALLLWLLTGVPAIALAQPTPGWHGVAEANASTLFGASSQTLTALAAGLSHVGDGFTADGGFKFRYGESEDEQQVKFVSSRGWTASVSIDGTPKGQFSPFFFGLSEASLEKRIANRSSGGVGAKWTFARTNTGSASISLAILGEHTTPMRDSIDIASTSVARWSWRVKTEQRIDDRLSFTHVTFYAPIVNAPAQYTINSTSVGSCALNKTVALTLTFTDNFDSQARTRGARSNNDGSLLFGIQAKL